MTGVFLASIPVDLMLHDTMGESYVEGRMFGSSEMANATHATVTTQKTNTTGTAAIQYHQRDCTRSPESFGRCICSSLGTGG
ncbi:hypothetical protein BG842_23305 [Haladaptatus sp. W1]|nr:hypothetical protein BG842_23305 [Haladaptatus sp. W1]